VLVRGDAALQFGESGNVCLVCWEPTLTVLNRSLVFLLNKKNDVLVMDVLQQITNLTPIKFLIITKTHLSLLNEDFPLPYSW